MASEKTVDPDWQELNAIRSFVAGFRFRGKPMKVPDAHCLISKETQIKNYLKSKWNLSELDGFFLKYPHYFTLTANREIYLQDPSLEVLEIDCALWFFRFMKARNNLPIHVELAYSCIPTSIVTEYLKSKFDANNLTSFFQRHSDVFVVKFSYVYLRPPTLRASASSQTKVESNSQTPLSRQARKQQEKKAVDFYVNLLKTRPLISTLHAHSFIGDDQELHSYLRDTYTISNLTAFFVKYPKIFAVHGSMVALVPNRESPGSTSSSASTSSGPNASSENTTRTQPEESVLPVEKRAVEFYKTLIAKKGPISATNAHSFLGPNVEIREWLKKHYIYNNLTSFFQNYPHTFNVKGDLVDLTVPKSKNTAQPQTGKSKSPAPEKQKRTVLKTEVERRAVDFYVKVLETRVLISMLHALSFIHKEPELQSHLRETYSSGDLTAFFGKYPKIFIKYGSLVGLVSDEDSVSTVPSENVKEPQQTESLKTVSSEKIKQPQPEKCDFQGSSGKSIPSNSPASTPNLKNYPMFADVVKEGSAAKHAPSVPCNLPASTPNLKNYTMFADEVKESSADKHAQSIPSNSPASTPDLKNYTIFGDEVKKSPAVKIAPCLLSKIMMCTSSQHAATNGSSERLLPLSRQDMFRDAACQTLSSGPILSLSVFDELEKAS